MSRVQLCRLVEFAANAANQIQSIFRAGMYEAKNTVQPANVRANASALQQAACPLPIGRGNLAEKPEGIFRQLEKIYHRGDFI